jgi:putative transposase
MPNHFHFLIRIKANTLSCQTTLKVSDSSGFNQISNAFKNFFTSYTNSFNKTYHRRGSLFQPRFKRLPIENVNHLLNTIIYINNNPIIHGFTQNISEWPYSSYNKVVENNNLEWFKQNEVIALFNDKENFIFCHDRKFEIDKFEC